MKKIIHSLGYVFCNRIVLAYIVLASLFMFTANLNSFEFGSNLAVLAVCIIAIVGWASFIVCELPHIKRNRWERRFTDWLKRITAD